MTSAAPGTSWMDGFAPIRDKLFSYLAVVFDVRKRTNQWLILGLISTAVLLVVVSFFGLNYSHKGAVFHIIGPRSKVEGAEGIATESLAILLFVLSLIVNFAILVWSIATLQSQKEQGERTLEAQKEQNEKIRKMLTSSQSLGPDVAKQMRLLEEDFRRHLSGREYDFELTVYVSSPGFGIVGGSEGVGYFVKILTAFIDLAIARATHPSQKLHSSLELFFWTEDDHKAALGSNRGADGLWLWANGKEKEREDVLAELKKLASKFEDLQKLNSKYITITQRVAKRDELRFVFLKQGGRNLWAGMMAFAPLEKVIHIRNHLHNVLLVDHSDNGAHEIYDFFQTFLDAYEHDAAPDRELILKQPRTMLANFFDLPLEKLA